MESYCDIIDQLPSEVYNNIFGDKAKDFVQLRSLRSRVKAKILKFDKFKRKEETTCVPNPRPKSVPVVESVCDMDDDEEMCEDLIDFLKLNEEERDSWGAMSDSYSKIFFFLINRKHF